MRIVQATILVSLVSGVCAQQTELSGQVLDSRGQAIAGAEISFRLLATNQPRESGAKGSYILAQARHLKSIGPIVSASDQSGQWQRPLTPTEAAILTINSYAFRMEVRARGYLNWSRTIAGDLRSRSIELAQLDRGRQGAYLEVALTGGQRPFQGYAMIERPFRVQGDRSIWLPSLVPLTQRGGFRFAQPPRIPGELLAQSPTARAEAYRVRIYAVGLQPVERMMPVGSWQLQVQASPAAVRPVLDPDGNPATTPIRATYILGRQEVELEFQDSHVALLGDRPPLRVSNANGEARITVWDPMQAIRLAAEEPESSEHAELDSGLTTLTLTVADRKGRPAVGSAVWLEDASVRTAPPTTKVFAVTDARGIASLDNLPRGTHRLLLRHPTAGWRELQLKLEARSEAAALSLRPATAFRRPNAGQPGTLLLDMGLRNAEQSKAPIELGFITKARQLIRQDFAYRPRWIRLEGLAKGPISLYLRSQAEPAVLVAGILSGTFDNSALEISDIRNRRFQLSIRDVEGRPLRNAAISFGESNASAIPYTSSLITLQKGKQPGNYFFETPIHGSPLLRIHDRDGGFQDVIIPVKLNEEYLEVVVGGR